MMFEENWPRGFRGEVASVYGRTDDGRHPEPLAQVS